MPFSPSFAISQSAATPASVTFTDDSTGSDVLNLIRRIYITDNEGNPVVPSGYTTDYIVWPLATNPLTVSGLLSQNTSVNIDVQWLGAGDAVLYELDNDFCLREFGKQFFIYLIQNQALSPNIVQDSAYYGNLCQFYINLQGANVMVEDANDLSGSQNCLDRLTEMEDNQTKYF